MTVEERRPAGDRFPVGLRVLAVDDDPTCLRLLEPLLRRCQYHVTTTNQAIMALKLLRENKDIFDLVISDVHMPDMDGFKLLELVGLEMDLPVIMLSGNSDPKVVLKGITHGACDYLLKPVRLEELRNIWQHVVRRRKLDVKERRGRDHGDGTPRHANSEGGHGPALSGSSERNVKLNRKRKDQDEEDDDDFDENGQENEDSSSQKKPRVVWSVELHGKFVAAVNQLGIDKAMPKRILDLMNVEKLTRENVASHLQKYRLFLKRISNQQANMVAVLGGKDAQFLSMGSLDGMRNYHSFPGSGLASFQQAGMLGRLNSAGNQALYGLGSAGMIQLGRAHGNVSNPVHDLGKFPQISFYGSQQGNLIQGMPTLLESSQLQQQPLMIESGGNLLNGSSNLKAPLRSASNTYPIPANNIQILQTQQQQQPVSFGNQSSGRLTTSSDLFDSSVDISPNPPDLSRCNETWATSAPVAGYTQSILPLGTSFGGENESSTSTGDRLSAVILKTESNRQNADPSNAMVSSLSTCQVKNFNPNTGIMCSNDSNTFGLSDVGGMCSSIQRWDNQTNQTFQQGFPFISSTHSMLDMVNNNVGFNPGAPTKTMDTATMNHSNVNAPYFVQNHGLDKPVADIHPKQKEDCVLDSARLQGGFNYSSGYDTFDELMSALVKREREDILMDSGNVNCDLFSLETCI